MHVCFVLNNILVYCCQLFPISFSPSWPSLSTLVLTPSPSLSLVPARISLICDLTRVICILRLRVLRLPVILTRQDKRGGTKLQEHQCQDVRVRKVKLGQQQGLHEVYSSTLSGRAKVKLNRLLSITDHPDHPLNSSFSQWCIHLPINWMPGSLHTHVQVCQTKPCWDAAKWNQTEPPELKGPLTVMCRWAQRTKYASIHSSP